MKIPDRWLPYKAIGKQIAGTRFICFKVPLKEQICQQLEEVKRFTPENLLDQCPEMKLIVDLTNTKRFYDGKVFEDNGVEYKKIQTPGHVIPASGYIKEFFTAVDSFLSSSSETDSLIGVHCTHGLNRTSYFVCCYMIHRMGFEPQEAVTAFEDARGHKIERQYYVDDLLKRGMGSDDLQTNYRARGGCGPDRTHNKYMIRTQPCGTPDSGRNWRDRDTDNSRHQQSTSNYPGIHHRERISHANRQYPNRYHASNSYEHHSNVQPYHQGQGRYRGGPVGFGNDSRNYNGGHGGSNEWRGQHQDHYTRSSGNQGAHNWRSNNQPSCSSDHVTAAVGSSSGATTYAEHRKQKAEQNSGRPRTFSRFS